jgi:SAM-dependent methyltransferase
MHRPHCPVCSAENTLPFWHNNTRSYWRCPVCLTTFLDPSQRPDKRFEQAYYQTHRNDVNDQGYRNYLSPMLPPLLEKLKPGSNGLDFGCGPGPALAAMLTEAGHLMQLYDPQFCNTPEVLTRTYDFVTCSEVVEHFHSPDAEFSRLGLLLKPGGWLAVMTRFLLDDEGFERWHYRRDPTHVVFYKPATFQHIASLNGWRCEIPCNHVALLQKPHTTASTVLRADKQ